MTLAASLNKAAYAPGETMTLTVTSTVAERDQDMPITVTVSVPSVGETTVVARIDRPPIPLTVTDPDRTWTRTSDNGATAIYTAVA